MDPDQVASSEATRSGSTVFSIKDKSGFSRTRVKVVGWYFSLFVPISIGSILFEKEPVFGNSGLEGFVCLI